MRAEWIFRRALPAMALALAALPALAQRDDAASVLGAGLGAGMIGFMCCFYVAIYVYFAFCIYKIAQKCNVEMAWLAWIPIVQVVPLIQAARKPLWWIVLLLIPLVNIVIGIIIWMGVAEQRGKPSWVGILMIVPLVNLVIPAYLAFSD
jgi:hypothetical protein